MEKKAPPSINDAWKVEHLHVKKMELEQFLTAYRKINSKWIKVLNVRTYDINILEKNIARAVFDINCSKIFFDPPPRIMD